MTECYVFDSSALINTRDLNKILRNKKNTIIFFSEEALKELNSPVVKGKFEIIKESYNLIITFPSKESFNYATNKCRKLGILNRISKIDISILALLVELKKENKCRRLFLVSDDYWMQNFAMNENIPFITAMFKGIKKVKKWALQCEYCSRVFENINEIECPVCGGPLKRIRKK